MNYYNKDDIDPLKDYTIVLGHRGTGKAFARVKYYLDILDKTEIKDADKLLLVYLQLESYCECLLDLGFISHETYDKILSINYKEVIKHDD